MPLSKCVWPPLVGLFVLACDAPAPRENVLFHAGTLNGILAGAYDGQFEVQSVRQHGDFGLGAFHALDGEMIVLDGNVYQITHDGKVHAVPDSAKTPYAAVTFFRPEQRATWSSGQGATFEDFLEHDVLLPQRLYAIKVRGRFKRLLARSVPPQTRPYRPLTEVIATSQKTFHFENVEGTLVGYRLPPFVAGVNLTGYHFHFLDRSRTAGGHVLEYEMERGDVEVQLLHGYAVELPEAGAFYDAGPACDRQNEIRVIK